MRMRSDVAAALKRARRPVIYLLYGEDTYSRNRCVQELEQALASASGGADLNSFDAGAASFEDMASAVMMAPMFGGSRVVTVRRFELMPGEDQERFLARLVQGPGPEEHAVAPDTALIISSASKTIPRGLVVAGGANVAAFEFRAARAREAQEFVRWKAAEMGLTIDFRAAQAIQEMIGSDLEALAGEVEKLALFLGPDQRRITLEHIKAAVGINPTLTVFNLFDSIVDGNPAAAYASLADVMKSGRNAVWVQSTLAGLLRTLMRARSDIDRGIRKAPGDWRVEKAFSQARKLSQATLARMVCRVAQADRDIKTGAMGQELCMDMLVSDLCALAKQKPQR
nr:DNA polymerase III subunit delta [Bacillota bacterium]